MNKLAWIVPMLSLLACDAAVAGRHEHLRIQVVNEPDSELCKSASAAMKSWFESTGHDRFSAVFRRYESIPKTDLQIQDLTFHVLRHGTLETLDAKGERRQWTPSYYAVDIDNNGSVDMLGFASGGHLKAGEGDTLSVMERNFMAMPQPVSHEAVRDEVALELGPLELYFIGQDFGPGYYVYPIAFKQRNYLLIEENGDMHYSDKLRRQVIEVVPGTGPVGRCYF